MFHNVLMTTLTPMRDSNEVHCWIDRPFTTIWPEVKQEKSKETSIKKTIKKKKRNRTMFTTDQVRVLEKIFTRTKYIDVERRREISECLQIEQKCIKIWFQNRRMKEKKELSESCDSTSESQGSIVESLSPPPKLPQPANNELDVSYTRQGGLDHVGPTHYYYGAPNNYIKTDVHQNEQSSYETSKDPTVPEYVYNFNSNMPRNNTEYTAPYYLPHAECQYYYNAEEVNNQYIPNVGDWPASIFNAQYF